MKILIEIPDEEGPHWQEAVRWLRSRDGDCPGEMICISPYEDPWEFRFAARLLSAQVRDEADPGSA